ncbi:glycosyltransferase family 21 protein [Hydnum rufescens UP504]|uniref:Ceramide glucosyltransferase n=1 Tax=Hydnum rufescens UP504 TaxID=1448309 RepID=A0A9P6BBA4_9AGAM|nr:glycosyltransferase family 21 protein [Hydnum rufescens UP504]
MATSQILPTWETVFLVFHLIALIWYCAFWCVGLLGWATVRKTYTRRPHSPLSYSHPQSVPGVSIIRPLKGLDPNLYENLESSLNQDYPNFEVIFSVQDENDQALQVVYELVTKYPDVPVQIIRGDEVVGMNPKINNLVKPFRQAKNDILWVLDSNVWIEGGALARSVETLTQPFPESNSPDRPRVGLVHHVPFAKIYASQHTIGSRIEEAFLNTNHAKMYVAINRIAIASCVVGKSNMYRRSDINKLTGLPSARNRYKACPTGSNGDPEDPTHSPDTVTGLAAFGGFLAEDNMIAEGIMNELGLVHSTSCDIAVNAIGSMSFMDYVERRIRWIRVRKHMVLLATLLEPLTECLALCCVGAWGLGAFFNFSLSLFFLAHIGLWLTVDLGVYSVLAASPLQMATLWPFIGAWVLREIVALPIWLIAVLGSDVVWRGELYTVTLDGRMQRNELKSARTRRLPL